ncbi:hypothetical protein AB0P21_20980 [Kribbella sp. NPDC056861]|uniref:hypothetical protein n=1 Tax=Kribbella sp. NPDC056861 TaxID=3154857 RepID=UPI003423CACB
MSAVDPRLAELVWYGTAKLRRRAHVLVGQAQCPTRGVPYSGTGGNVHQLCRDVGCLGIMHEVYARAIQRLGDRREAMSPIKDRLGYARTIVSSQVADYERDGRVRRGLPAKPTRNDGIAARINGALDERAADDRERHWLRMLFRMMRGYACRDDRRSAVWPVDVWAGEKSTVDGVLRVVGATTTRAELSADIHLVLVTAEQVAGRRWVDDFIRHPLLTFAVPLTEDHQRELAAPTVDPADVVAVAALRTRFRSLMQEGASAQEALDRSADEVLGHRAECDVCEVLDDLLAPEGDQDQPIP